MKTMTSTSARIALGATMLAAATLAACSGNGGSSSAVVQPVACSAPGLMLVYPPPNATGIPDTFQGVIFGSSSALPSTSQALVGLTTSSVLTGLSTVVAAPTPLPTPLNAPTYANPVYSQSSSSGFVLSAATPISVYYNDSGSNCTPVLLGTFTSK